VLGLLDLEVDHAVNVIRLNIQQDDVAADDHVPATFGSRSQTRFQVFRHWLDSLLQAGRQSTAFLELLLKARRELIPLG
jgi:hypothetical protein